jgi:excisionase family DNA binding protein
MSFDFDVFDVFGYTVFLAKENLVTTLSAGGSRRNRPATENSISAACQVLAVTDERFGEEIREVVSGLSEAFVSKLLAQYKKQRSSTQDFAKWKRLMESTVPTVLAEAFAEEFLGSSDATRWHRALLFRLLCTAELRSLNKPVVTTAPHRGRSRKSAEATSGADDLTSEEAARLLHVSRTHLNTLVDEGKFGEVRHTEGGHRRIPRAAVLAYRGKSKMTQTKGLDKMVEASGRMGLYDAELEGGPVRSKAR